MYPTAPRLLVVLALVLVALTACSSSTFKDDGLDRLMAKSSAIRADIASQQIEIQDTLQRTTRFINAVPIGPVVAPDASANPAAHDQSWIRTILIACFNQPIQDTISACQAEPLRLYLDRKDLDEARAQDVRDRVERIMSIQHKLKSELPQMLFDMSEMVIVANTLTRSLNSQLETLNPEDTEIKDKYNEDGIAELNQARLQAEGERDGLRQILSVAEPSLDLLNQKLDDALEQTVYNLISFGLPVTLKRDELPTSGDAPAGNAPIVKPPTEDAKDKGDPP